MVRWYDVQVHTQLCREKHMQGSHCADSYHDNLKCHCTSTAPYPSTPSFSLPLSVEGGGQDESNKNTCFVALLWNFFLQSLIIQICDCFKLWIICTAIHPHLQPDFNTTAQACCSLCQVLFSLSSSLKNMATIQGKE